MKTPLAIVLAASLVLCGCSVFQRSEVWDTVVKSRSEYSGGGGMGDKDGYINHLHRVLTDAGVEHKIVTYQFHFWNAYREDSVQTATAVIYRDDWNAKNPWWVMDEYRTVPVWLPSWPLAAQLEFFLHRDAEVLSEKSYGAAASRPLASAKPRRSIHQQIAAVPKPRKPRATFASSRAKAPALRPEPAPAEGADPLSATTLTGGGGEPVAGTLFRSTHGTAFDPASAIDRQKMQALKRQLFDRNRNAKLRTE